MTTPDPAELIGKLRADKHAQPVDPKAVYRTRPVALFEEAADALAAADLRNASLVAERDAAREALLNIAPAVDPLPGEDCTTTITLFTDGGKIITPGPCWSAFRKAMEAINALEV